MASVKELSYDLVKQSVAENTVAFRRIVQLEPAGGAMDKIFPPTYEGGEYAEEIRLIDGEQVPCVLLDSVQSQANRMEMALLDGLERNLIKSLPVIEVDFGETDAAVVGKITSLEAPHRAADAILRDSMLEGVPFENSELGEALNSATMKDARALFRYCPTSLIFGTWFSTGKKGGMGTKFQRAIVSEIVGLNAVKGKKTQSRIDPLQIPRAATLFQKREAPGEWTPNEEEAERDKKDAPILWGEGEKKGRPSSVVHGNITPSITDGGYTIGQAQQTTVISLPAIRRYRFPSDNPEKTPAAELAARTVLVCMALCAATLDMEQGYDLRSRCLLIPTEPPTWEILGSNSTDVASYSLSPTNAAQYLERAFEEASKAGLAWEKQPVVMQPQDKLVGLVLKSIDLTSGSHQGSE